MNRRGRGGTLRFKGRKKKNGGRGGRKKRGEEGEF